MNYQTNFSSLYQDRRSCGGLSSTPTTRENSRGMASGFPSRPSGSDKQKIAEAYQQVFNNPYLLLLVLERLPGDHMSLASAVRVNSLWFNEGTKVLWRQPPVAALVATTAGRRQLYADKVVVLVVYPDESESHYDLENVRFPRLRYLYVAPFSSDRGHHWIEKYLQENLRALYLLRAPLPDNFFSSLSVCRHLITIYLDGPLTTRFDSGQFFDFLKQARSLKSMLFTVRMGHCITDEVIVHLAEREGLELLTLGGCIGDRRRLTSIIARVPRPFPVLRALQTSIGISNTCLLLACLNDVSLTKLVLKVQETGRTDRGHDILQQLARFQRLKYLELRFDMEHSLSGSDVPLLGKLPLQTLHLSSANPNFRADGLTDQEIIQLTMGLSNLRSLKFPVVNSSISVKSLDTIAKHCRFLEHCELGGRFDLTQLDGSDGVAFPELRKLDLFAVFVDEAMKLVLPKRIMSEGRSANHRKSMETTTFARLMEHHFPRLKDLLIVTVGRKAYDLLHGLADTEEWDAESERGTISRERGLTEP